MFLENVFYTFIYTATPIPNQFCVYPGDRVQTSWVNPLGVYDSSTALWRQGKGQQETEQEKPEAHAGQSAALLTGRTEEFNRQLREQPADTQLWIQFIKYQVGESDCIVSGTRT